MREMIVQLIFRQEFPRLWLKCKLLKNRANNIKFKNRRTQKSIGYAKTWAHYVDKICNSRYARDLSNLEQEEVTTFIYDTLTKIDETEEDRLNVYSLKKFIANAIDYSCD